MRRWKWGDLRGDGRVGLSERAGFPDSGQELQFISVESQRGI